jgi:hypothetical protein
MMLRNLIDEVRSRRVLAFAALGVLVALALPLLFIKGAPTGAPAADTAAPAAAKEAKLPPRAARLLAATDATNVNGHASGSTADPFNPPASYRAAVAAAAAKAGGGSSSGGKGSSTGSGNTNNATAGAGTPSKPIPVVIKNADGSSTTTHSTGTPSSSSAPRSSSTPSTHTVAVDVRFGKQKDSAIRRAIPRNQGFYIHGKLVALFLKYSPSRHKAIFAVAPSLHISGPVKCRVQNNVCRYLDMPAGSHAWLTTIIDNKLVVTRRLDVVHTARRGSSSDTKATAASDSADGACLLRKLRAMAPGDALLDRDACER